MPRWDKRRPIDDEINRIEPVLRRIEGGPPSNSGPQHLEEEMNDSATIGMGSPGNPAPAIPTLPATLSRWSSSCSPGWVSSAGWLRCFSRRRAAASLTSPGASGLRRGSEHHCPRWSSGWPTATKSGGPQHRDGGGDDHAVDHRRDARCDALALRQSPNPTSGPAADRQRACEARGRIAEPTTKGCRPAISTSAGSSDL